MHYFDGSDGPSCGRAGTRLEGDETSSVGFCCHLSRREFIRWAGLVAATPLLLSLEERSARATSPAVPPVNLELVTLTESSAVLTWFTGDLSKPPDSFGRLAPAPADTELWLGTSAQNLRLAYQDSAATAYHYAEITGLEPGQTYFYVAKSNGVPAVPAASANGSPIGSSMLGLGSSRPGVATSPPSSFTTPQPAPAPLLRCSWQPRTAAQHRACVRLFGGPRRRRLPRLLRRRLLPVGTDLVRDGVPGLADHRP